MQKATNNNKEISLTILIILSIVGIIYFFNSFKEEREMTYQNINTALMNILKLDKQCSLATEQIAKASKEKDINNQKLWNYAREEINKQIPIYIKDLDKALENGTTGLARVALDSKWETSIYDYSYFSNNKKQSIQNLIDTFIDNNMPITQDITITIEKQDGKVIKAEKKIIYTDDYAREYYNLECLNF
ncbi:hypothetical protein [Helicobacter japonicus]|uniref:hypothetical protein n=1 Tax=Helicobacter japonicus TaxID=425400 RepID=UPI0023EF9E14|nr:hypothetical protein [Helicobacter japonicus]